MVEIQPKSTICETHVNKFHVGWCCSYLGAVYGSIEPVLWFSCLIRPVSGDVLWAWVADSSRSRGVPRAS